VITKKEEKRRKWNEYQRSYRKNNREQAKKWRVTAYQNHKLKYLKQKGEQNNMLYTIQIDRKTLDIIIMAINHSEAVPKYIAEEISNYLLSVKDEQDNKIIKEDILCIHRKSTHS